MPIPPIKTTKQHGDQNATNIVPPINTQSAQEARVNANVRATFSESAMRRSTFSNVAANQRLTHVTHEAALSQVARLSTQKSISSAQNQGEPGNIAASRAQHNNTADKDSADSEYSVTEMFALQAAITDQTSQSAPALVRSVVQKTLPLTQKPLSKKETHEYTSTAAEKNTQTELPAIDKPLSTRFASATLSESAQTRAAANAENKTALLSNNVTGAEKSNPPSQNPVSETLTPEGFSVIQHTILPTIEKLIQGQSAKAAQMVNPQSSAETKLAALTKAEASNALLDTRVKTQIHIQGVDDTRVQVALTDNKLEVNIATIAGSERSFDSAALANLRDILEQKYPNLQIAIALNVSTKEELHQPIARDMEHSSSHTKDDDAQQHDDTHDQRQKPHIDDTLYGEGQ